MPRSRRDGVGLKNMMKAVARKRGGFFHDPLCKKMADYLCFKGIMPKLRWISRDLFHERQTYINKKSLPLFTKK